MTTYRLSDWNLPTGEDCSKQLNKEIAKLRHVAGVTIVIDGDYLVQKGVVCHYHKGLTIAGPGKLTGMEGCWNILYAGYSPGLVMEGFTLDGNRESARGVEVRVCDRARLDGLNIFQIGNSSLDNTNAINLRGDSFAPAIERCKINGVYSSRSASGIAISNKYGEVLRPTIRNCVITDLPEVLDSDGIRIFNIDNDTSGIIEDCYFGECAKRAIKTQTNGMIIRCNFIHGSQHAGISCQVGRHNRLFDNTIEGADDSHYGIFLWCNGDGALSGEVRGGSIANSKNGVTIYGAPDQEVTGGAFVSGINFGFTPNPVRIYADKLDLLRVDGCTVDDEAKSLITMGGYWGGGKTYRPKIGFIEMNGNYTGDYIPLLREGE